MALLLKGAPVAAAVSEKAAARAAALRARGVLPTLAIVRVGAREDDVAYEKGAMRRCADLGVGVRNVLLPAELSTGELLKEIEALNGDASVHGVLLFRPLPKQLDEGAACAALCPEKDVDGIAPDSMARVYSGAGPGFPPCTAQACMEILKHYGIDPAGKRAAVIGRSLVIGRPAALLLTAADATVTLCHTKTADLPAATRAADIVVAAAGKAEALGAAYFREGQVVLDVGISWSEEKQRLVGDVDFACVEPLVGAITPVPGGVGSVTAAVLCSHVLKAAERATK